MSTIVFQEANCWYKWVRAVYTRTSGSITATTRFQKKGMHLVPAMRNILHVAASTNGPADADHPLDGTVAEAATFTTAGISVRDAEGFSLIFSCGSTGTPVGTIKLQGSLDSPKGYEETIDAAVSTWFDIPFLDESTGQVVTEQAITGAGNTVLLSRGRGPARTAAALSASTDNGQNLSLSDTDAHAFGTSAAASIGVMVSAPLGNTAAVYIGLGSGVTSGNTGKGIELQPGDREFFPVSNATLLYAITGTATQNVHALAL